MKINDQKRLYCKNIVTQTDILWLPESRGLDVTVVGGQCADSIRRIHRAMNRLAPMGDDELRTVWVEIRGKRLEWYRFSTSVYKGIHNLYVTGDPYDHHVVCDKDNGHYHQCYYEDQLVDVFARIEKYIVCLIDSILADPQQYNAYVEKYLSYHRRKGLIKRSILNSLIPGERFEGIDVPRAIKLYENPKAPVQFDEMTLRRYMHYWRIAYEAVYGKQQGDDIEVFRHSSKEYETKDFNLDSKEDFKRWEAQMSPFHAFDVVYARVHLYACEENGKWHLYVGTCSYWNLDQCLQVVLGLDDAGLSVELGEVDQILGILKETDYVEITPYAYRYMQSDNVGSQMMLPYAEDVGKDTLKQIIANTDWKKIPPLAPNRPTI